MLLILKQNVIKSLKHCHWLQKHVVPWYFGQDVLAPWGKKMELAAWTAALINFNTDATNFSPKM